MAKRKEFVVIGLGRFGSSLVNALLAQNQIVTALDINQELVDSVASKVNFAACIDSTDEEALKEVGVKNADYIIVAIGSDAEASFMTVAVLKEMGISNIIVKSSSKRMSKILEKIGADQIVNPEFDSGIQLALRLMQTNIEEVFPLDKNHSLVYLKVENNEIGKSNLQELRLREKFSINIVAIKRNEKLFIPSAEDSILLNDILLVVGINSHVVKFEDYLK